MEGTGATSEGLAGVHQRVFSVERRAAVRLLVLGAVRGRTGETRAGGGPLDPGADVTPHHLLARRCRRHGDITPACGSCGALRQRAGPGRRHRKSGGAVTSLFELVGDESKNFIDAELRTLVKLVLAEGTGADGAGRPVPADAHLQHQRASGEAAAAGASLHAQPACMRSLTWQKLCPHGVDTGSSNRSRQMEQVSSCSENRSGAPASAMGASA